LGGLSVKNLRVVKVYSSDGNYHYVLQESRIFNAPENDSDIDVAEIKRISKEDAAKPLFVEHE
jgi:hypothetical protein